MTDRKRDLPNNRLKFVDDVPEREVDQSYVTLNAPRTRKNIYLLSCAGLFTSPLQLMKWTTRMPLVMKYSLNRGRRIFHLCHSKEGLPSRLRGTCCHLEFISSLLSRKEQQRRDHRRFWAVRRPDETSAYFGFVCCNTQNAYDMSSVP